MRLAFHKEIVRSITRSWTRFFAIFAIVALGAGFYAGLRMCAPDMRATVDAYADDSALMDIQVVSTLGLSDADVEAVRSIDGVLAVMPSHAADVTATIGERRETVRVHALDFEATTLNKLALVAGRLPQASGECLIDSSKVLANTSQVGDAVTIADGVADPQDVFARTDFTVVGVVDSAYYLSVSRGTTPLNDGNIDRVLYVAPSDFAEPDTFTELFVSVDGARGVASFSDAYDSLVDPVISSLEDLAPQRESARLAEVQDELRDEIDDARAEYEEGKAEAETRFAEALVELEDCRAEIARAESTLASGQRRYDSGKAVLAAEKRAFATTASDAQAQIDAGRAEIEAKASQIAPLAAALPVIDAQRAAAAQAVTDLQAAYDAALAAEGLGETPSPSSAELGAQLLAATTQLTAVEELYATRSATYGAAVSALSAARAQLDAKQAELDAGRARAQAEFASAQRTLDAARRDLAAGRAELKAGSQELAEGQATYEREKAEAEAELADALAEIEEAATAIDEIEPPTWYVLGRDANMGYASFAGDAERIEAIGVVFPFIFFLVAALVALTTMTRMVDEERTLIGTYKALGYGKNRIVAKYLVYAGVASVAGSVMGIIVGSQVLPRVVWNAYTTMYTAPAMLTPIDLPLALLAGLGSVGVTLVATLLAVEADLRENPAALMLPRAPRAGQRILLERVTPIWSRMSFSHKVTARNLFRYKKRLLMTVVGIAGCTGLLLTGFAIRDSISDILVIQYGEIYGYNVTVGLDESTSTDALAPILNDPSLFADHLPVHVEGVRIRNIRTDSAGEDVTVGSGFGGMSGGVLTGTTVDGHLLVPDASDRLEGFIDLRQRVGGAPIELDDSGVVLTEKVADTLDLSVGDTVYIERLDAGGAVTGGPVAAFTVSGISEQYIVHYAYITPSAFGEAFGEVPVHNQALAMALDTGEESQARLSQILLEQDGVTTVQFTDDVTSSFDDLLASLDSVVVVLIVSAGMLAFIVLYNLTNINIVERQREIATIKVLGFYDAEVNAYIYRETAALAGIGCALGLVLGVYMTRFVIATVEVDVVMFGRSIHWQSFVYAAVLTLLFALIVNLAMAPRLRSIDMVESLKSVE